jgi:hypothetical protein
MRSTIPLLATALLGLFPLPAKAGWPPGGLMVAPYSYQFHPRLVSTPSGKVLVYWQDLRQDLLVGDPFAPGDLYCQLVTAAGMLAPGWPDTGLMVARADEEQQPAAALACPDGSFLVGINDGRAFPLRTTRYDAYLSKVRPDVTIDPAWPRHGYQITARPFDEYPYRMVWAAPDTAVMASMHGIVGVSDSSHELVVQRVSVGPGAPQVQWDPTGKVVAKRRYLFDIGLTADGAGGVFTMFHYYRGTNGADPGDGDIFLLRLDRNGEPMPGWPVTGLPVAVAPGYQEFGALCEDGAGGVYLAWSDARAGAGLPYPDYNDYEDIRLLRLGPDGTPRPGWPAEGVVVCNAAGLQECKGVLADGAGGVYITWEDWRPEFTPPGTVVVTARQVVTRVRADGSLYPGWPVNGQRVSTLDGLFSGYQMVLDGGGGVYVKYEEYAGGIYLQHLLANGAQDPRWLPTGNQVTDSSDESWLETDHLGGCYVAFLRPAPGTVLRRVMLQRYGIDGVVGTELAEASAEPGAGGVRLVWRGASLAGITLRVERREEPGSTWAQVGTPTLVAAGRAEYLDRDVRPGARYGWRLVRPDGEVASEEAWTTLPEPFRFALLPARPNPARSAELQVAFTLAEPGAVSVEVFDVAGRREHVREVTGLPPGAHKVDLKEAHLAPGLHWLRLTQGVRTASLRLAVIR